MPIAPHELDPTLALIAEGRYVIGVGGEPCGEEAWRMAANAGGIVVTGEQVLRAPHPFPNTQSWRAALTREWRPASLAIEWDVGEKRLRALHEAEGARWSARIEYEGQVKSQSGDFPDFCEVEYPSHLFNTFILARRDFAVGGEHEFPVLRIGPPWMAVNPDRMLIRCAEKGIYAAPWGEVPAKRYVLSLPPRSEEEGYTFWADQHDVVLESFEGPEPVVSWMKLVEYHRH